MESGEALLLTSKDNVATCLRDVQAGSDVRVRLGKETRYVRVLEGIPFGFKIAVERIPKGSGVVKYGESIGIASSDIEPGQLVHVHNIEGGRGRGDLKTGGAT